LAAKYDSEVEAEVVQWFKQLLDEDVPRGMGAVMNHLKSGISLVNLAIKVREGTPNCPAKAKKMRLKPNTLSAPFKQMENIQVFLNFCDAYGVPKTGLFQTVDLYEGRNMAQFLNSVQQLGTEAQRQAFTGPVIGPKPVEQNKREFSAETIAAGKTHIGLQAGTNKCASQSGMAMGSVRHVSDIRADDFDRAGAGDIGMQAGSNKHASQAGMSMGAVRHVSDIRCDDFDKAGSDIIGLQAGSNKGASQSGMSMGSTRHAADIRADDFDKSANVIGLQSGSNQGASQAGMAMGGVRHCADIKVDAASAEGQATLGLQMGSNKGASQAGMAMGATRHVADIKVDAASQEGAGIIGLQMGTNQGATQSGMTMGQQRHM